MKQSNTILVIKYKNMRFVKGRNLGSVERQLILNKLGKKYLNDDAVELIKEFAFRSVIQLRAEQNKKRMHNEFKKIDRRSMASYYSRWYVSFPNCLPRNRNSTLRKKGGSLWDQSVKMGATMCHHCGNYLGHYLDNGQKNKGFYKNESYPKKFAPRTECTCGMFSWDITEGHYEIHTWPPRDPSDDEDWTEDSSDDEDWSDDDSSDEDPFHVIWDPHH